MNKKGLLKPARKTKFQQKVILKTFKSEGRASIVLIQAFNQKNNKSLITFL